MTYDFIVEPKLIGLRFDSYQRVREGSPVVGYLISMQRTQGAATYFLFPTADQDLSQMDMPYPNGQTEPSDIPIPKSRITTAWITWMGTRRQT